MRVITILLSSLVLAFLLQSAKQAEAQQPPRPSSYRPPAGPTLSPYLLYSRRPTGIYDNYNAFIRPRIELRSTLRTQTRQIGQLDREVRDVQRDVTTLSEVRQLGVAPTGIGSSYQNYSHYYPGAAGR